VASPSRSRHAISICGAWRPVAALGVAIPQVTLLLYGLAALATAGAVTTAGSGFVGLIVPHALRSFGNDPPLPTPHSPAVPLALARAKRCRTDPVAGRGYRGVSRSSLPRLAGPSSMTGTTSCVSCRGLPLRARAHVVQRTRPEIRAGECWAMSDRMALARQHCSPHSPGCFRRRGRVEDMPANRSRAPATRAGASCGFLPQDNVDFPATVLKRCWSADILI
jgi:hypothetical protein